jgi:hypothetical protein
MFRQPVRGRLGAPEAGGPTGQPAASRRNTGPRARKGGRFRRKPGRILHLRRFRGSDSR